MDNESDREIIRRNRAARRERETLRAALYEACTALGDWRTGPQLETIELALLLIELDLSVAGPQRMGWATELGSGRWGTVDSAAWRSAAECVSGRVPPSDAQLEWLERLAAASQPHWRPWLNAYKEQL
jgi:hypothetical protein